MYIDDLTVGEVHALERSKVHITQNKEIKTIHAYKCEEAFNKISANATDIGMIINPAKTQLICMSDSRHSVVNSYIMVGDQRIDSVKEMKVLGFIFEDRPSVEAHVLYCIEKFSRAAWAIGHLKRANIDEKVLLEVYKVMLRPLLEYCSPIYHPMLSCYLSERLEKQQKRTLRMIYGFEKDYNDLLGKTGLESLELRRKRAFSTFTHKLAASERFEYLFPEQDIEQNMMALRNRKKYV